ncbi:hypothetical protein PS6_000345 [Mucor atramentarius]
MQIKFLFLGLLAAAVAAVAADTVNVHDTDVNAHNTFSGIANGVKVNDVAENLRANVASGLLSRREIADAICRPRLTRRNEDDKNRRKSLLRLLERQIKSETNEAPNKETNKEANEELGEELEPVKIEVDIEEGKDVNEETKEEIGLTGDLIQVIS